MFRCERCGTPHALPAGEALGPDVRPLATTPRHTPWFPVEYEPLLPGLYECEFHVEGLPCRVVLHWLGGAWTWGLAPVSTEHLVHWRGSW